MNIEYERLCFELKENLETQKALEEDLLRLPKGHVNTLYRNSKGYYYLTYRDGKKVKNDYLGPVGKTDLNDVFTKLRLRERYRKELKILKEEETELRKKIRDAE